MSGIASAAPEGHTGAVAQPPIIAVKNAIGAPASTMAGIGFLGTLLMGLSGQGLPTGSQGWFTFGIQALAGLGSIFMRA